MKNAPLFLHEEMMLLMLRDREGTILSSYCNIILGAAILGDLLLSGYVQEALNTKGKPVIVAETAGTPSNKLLAEALAIIRAAKRKRDAGHYATKFSEIARLSGRAAESLVQRRILKADRKKILLIFNRDIYPEIDPLPEAKLLARLRKAIELPGEPDRATAILVALAYRGEIGKSLFGKPFYRDYKTRLKEIGKDDVVAGAASSAIEAFILTIAVISTVAISSS